MPEVYVNVILQLNSPIYGALNAVGGSYVIPNEGNKGVIVTRTDFDQFAAFDATCTYDPNHSWGRVVPENSGVFGTDTVCHSKFFLMNWGSVFEGPATIPLKMYVAEYNSYANTLYIHN